MANLVHTISITLGKGVCGFVPVPIPLSAVSSYVWIDRRFGYDNTSARETHNASVRAEGTHKVPHTPYIVLDAHVSCVPTY